MHIANTLWCEHLCTHASKTVLYWRKLEGRIVLWICKIQAAQCMFLLMKNWDFLTQKQKLGTMGDLVLLEHSLLSDFA